MSVEYLSTWKKGATAEERLCEVSVLARKHPEQFARLAIIYQEERDGETVQRYVCLGLSTVELFGLLEMVKNEIWRTVRSDGSK